MTSKMFIRKLVLSNLLARKTRVWLTVAAVALSVSLVVAVTTGYASVLYAVHFYMDKYMGSIDAQVTRQNDPRGPISERVLEVLRLDPQVRRADGRIELPDPLIDKSGEGVDGRNVEVTGIARPGDAGVETMTMEKGAFFNTSEGNVAVIDQALAERIKEGVGDEVTLPRPDSKDRLKLKIVGIVHKPDIMAAAQQSMYVPLRTLQRFLGWDKPPESDAGDPSPAGAEKGGQINRITLEFNKGVDGRAFEKRMTTVLQKIDPNAKLRLTRDTRAELDKQLFAVELLSYLGGTVSMLAATFIVFSALSMGVTERQRTLAMLRAVGAFRGQVGVLVVYEGMILAISGVIVGAPLGWIWVKLLSLIFSDIFSSGVVVSWGGVAFGAVGSALAALVASALPAWWATRVRPLEAMTPDAVPPSRRAPFWSAAVGLLLICIDPFLFFGPLEPLAKALGAANPAQTAYRVQFFAHFGLGLPGIMIGFFLSGADAGAGRRGCSGADRGDRVPARSAAGPPAAFHRAVARGWHLRRIDGGAGLFDRYASPGEQRDTGLEAPDPFPRHLRGQPHRRPPGARKPQLRADRGAEDHPRRQCQGSHAHRHRIAQVWQQHVQLCPGRDEPRGDHVLRH